MLKDKASYSIDLTEIAFFALKGQFVFLNEAKLFIDTGILGNAYKVYFNVS